MLNIVIKLIWSLTARRGEMFKCHARPKPTQRFAGPSPKRTRSWEERIKPKPSMQYERTWTDAGLAYIWLQCSLFGFIHSCIGKPNWAQIGPWTWGAAETLCLVVPNPQGEVRANRQSKPQNQVFFILFSVSESSNCLILMKAPKLQLWRSLCQRTMSHQAKEVRADREGCVCFWGVVVPN